HPGECAAFPAGDANGHHIKNTSDAAAAFIVVGTRTKTETGYYSDEDMMVRLENGEMTFTRKDGGPLD
ncbi:MAG: transcriptional regulator, partial [Litoreibacter sp.]|nr:transcriptional regulator [Litoreibacter sp.]